MQVAHRHHRERFPPHRVPYRANMWALRSLDVRQVIAASAVGSLTASYGHGTLAVPDQLVDRTSGREQTVFDSGAVHATFADLYCLVGQAHALATACVSIRLRSGAVRHIRDRRGTEVLYPDALDGIKLPFELPG